MNGMPEERNEKVQANGQLLIESHQIVTKGGCIVVDPVVRVKDQLRAEWGGGIAVR